MADLSDVEYENANDQMLDGPLGDEQLSEWLSQLGDQQVTLPSLVSPNRSVAEEGGEDEEEPDEPGDDDEEEEPPSEEVEGTDYFTINGQQWPREDIERLYQFDQYLRSDPDAASRVAEAIRAPQPSVSSQAKAEPPTDTWEEPPVPEGLDLDDPRDKFMWQSMVNLQKSQYEIGQSQQRFLQQQAQDRQQQIDRQAAADMDTALGTFRSRYVGLNDDDVASIRMNAVPFVEGMMKQMPPVDALIRSLEVAAHMDPDMQDKLSSDTPRPTRHQTSQHRKSRLGSIAGTPRSAPKENPPARFQSDKDAINAFAQALAEQIQR